VVRGGSEVLQAARAGEGRAMTRCRHVKHALRVKACCFPQLPSLSLSSLGSLLLF